VARLLPTIRPLTERQYQLFFVLHTAMAQHRPEGFARILDADVAEAAGAFASTLETAARGVIYEHAPASPPARALAAALGAVLARIREQGGAVSDREAAMVLRAIERGARTLAAPAEGQTGYLDLMARLLPAAAAEPARAGAAPTSSLILP